MYMAIQEVDLMNGEYERLFSNFRVAELCINSCFNAWLL